MYKRLFLSGLIAVFVLSTHSKIEAHCQMPCGIYHDQMIYDKIDEFFETMIKAVTAMNNNEFKTSQERNQFIRWVITKEKECDEIAQLISTYFLQQKLKPGDEDSFDLVKSAHKMMFLLVQIKQNSDANIVREFGKEWDHFKELFHPEIECSKVVPLEHPKAKAENKEPAKAVK